MDKILFSIIIPTLNEEKLLPRILNQLNDKALKEKYNYEIILSDGGSKDNTIIVAKGLVDNLIIHNSEKKQNISEGRNKGAEIARGNLLIFINGDTIIKNPSNLFDSIIKYFLPNDYLAMTCNVNIDPSEAIFIDKIFHTFYNYYFHLLNLIGLGMGRGECQILRKKTFIEFNGFNPNLAAGEDFDLFQRIRKKGKIFFDHKNTVFESPRRFRKYGHFRILLTWLLNSIYVIFVGKSLSKEWKEIR